MSRINHNAESLIARRTLRMNHESPSEVFGRPGPDAGIERNSEGPAGLTVLHGCSAAFLKNNRAAVDSWSIARENAVAARNAVHDMDFAVEVSDLTQARILVAHIDQQRRGSRPNGQFSEQPDDSGPMSSGPQN